MTAMRKRTDDGWLTTGLSGLLVGLLAVLGAPSPARGQSLTISPASGVYATTQGFDLVLVVGRPQATITGGSALLDGADVTSALVACLVPGRLVPSNNGITFRCPGLTGGVVGAGTHTLAVTIQFANGDSVASTVTWQILASAGP